MKLEPIFLAPRPVPRSMPTRRAWLLAGGAFVVGAVTGGACVGLSSSAPTPPPRPLDPMHAWLRQLCDDATPVQELLTYRTPLLMNLPKWDDDPLLWHGIDRLAGVVIARTDLEDRRRIALELVDFLDHARLPTDTAGRWDLDTLRRVARGR